MAFNYNAGASAKDDVRLLIGDTDPNANADLRLEDEEISRLLVLLTGSASPGYAGTQRAAAEAADVLAAKFSRKLEGSSGGPGPSRTRAQELRATATRLRQESVGAALPTAGGISKAGKAAAEASTDRTRPAFRVGMFDNPDTGKEEGPCPER